MSVPAGSDDSTPSESNGETDDPLHDRTDHERRESADSLREAAVGWARHWKAWSLAAFSLAVVSWAAVVAPRASPKGYIPIFVGFALLAVGYVYLDEETQIRLASS